ncbi:MAG: type IV secretion system DNA-binding domain-containing protein [Pirellulales bacterium]|nr:type IV secretion system DNA-binding domain-containing protein [Pirellulales bacterium]
MSDYEVLGQFYLGKPYDLASGKTRSEYLLYDAKDLVTHALCVGMTGSGKTGLCLALLEEAAIDGIPAIIIDPKGDIANLCLTFPQLRPTDFQPWIDPGEATRQGKSVEEYATDVAARWKKGLGDWDQPPERIQKFRDAVEVAIYTPGSNAGLPLTVLKSFAAPAAAIREQPDALREQINSAVAGLLALLQIEGDPLRSREFILLATLLERAWQEGKDVALGELIREIQTPPFDKLGFLDLESFFPQKDRFTLAMALNNLLASPGFQTWLTGAPLDIQKLLYTSTGKPRHVILSIAHLSDAERMFFVTIVLNAVIAWMRAQTGTTSLRAILYMDEVFGYFPPTANPPSKTPMLTLLKQARAFGLGVVLATQNPVDLDYKGLSNCGTWFLGRLQTERDKLRVLDGLEGASTAAGAAFDRAELEKTLSSLGNRVFLMNNVHEDAPVVLQTRWALSYLRGPISSEQIRTLMAPLRDGAAATETVQKMADSASRPVLPPGIEEVFIARRAAKPAGKGVEYRPALYGTAKVHYQNAAQGIDHSENVTFLVPVDGKLTDEVWTSAEDMTEAGVDLDSGPEDGARFATLPAALCKAKAYEGFASDLRDSLYRTKRLPLWKYAKLKIVSQPGESQAEFRIRLSQAARELRDTELEKLRQKYSPKMTALKEQIRKAEQKVAKEKEQARGTVIQSVITIGSSVIGSVFGRKLASSANVGRAATGARAASRALSQQADVGHAEETVEALNARFEEMNQEFKLECEKIENTVQADKLPLEELCLTPKKADITVNKVVLAWMPVVV